MQRDGFSSNEGEADVIPITQGCRTGIGPSWHVLVKNEVEAGSVVQLVEG